MRYDIAHTIENECVYIFDRYGHNRNIGDRCSRQVYQFALDAFRTEDDYSFVCRSKCKGNSDERQPTFPSDTEDTPEQNMYFPTCSIVGLLRAAARTQQWCYERCTSIVEIR